MDYLIVIVKLLLKLISLLFAVPSSPLILPISVFFHPVLLLIVVEWLGLEGSPRIKFQSPCHRHGHQPPGLVVDQVVQGPIQPVWMGVLNISRDRASTNLGCLFQHLTLPLKKFPLTSNLNLLSLSLKSFASILSLST